MDNLDCVFRDDGGSTAADPNSIAADAPDRVVCHSPLPIIAGENTTPAAGSDFVVFDHGVRVCRNGHCMLRVAAKGVFPHLAQTVVVGVDAVQTVVADRVGLQHLSIHPSVLRPDQFARNVSIPFDSCAWGGRGTLGFDTQFRITKKSSEGSGLGGEKEIWTSPDRRRY